MDVGAHVGYFTALGGQIVGDEGHAYAFEPDPTRAAVVEQTVVLNELNNLTVEQNAVSNEAGSIDFYVWPVDKVNNRIFLDSKEERDAIQVEAISLDNYSAGRSDEIDFVKIDTQGAEAVILEGTKGILATHASWGRRAQCVLETSRNRGKVPGRRLY